MYCFKDNVILSIKCNNSGGNVCKFLTKITTNSINLANKSVYACILNSKGRFLLDLFIYPKSEDFCIIEIHKNFLVKLQEIVELYDIMEEFTTQSLSDYISVFSSKIEDTLNNKNAEPKNIAAAKDPRKENFGMRIICKKDDAEKYLLSQSDEFNYDKYRILHCICEGYCDLTPEKSIIMEFGFENLNSIDFNKGCYPGQELITRTKHLLNIKKSVICLPTNLPNELSGANIKKLQEKLTQLASANLQSTIESESIYNIHPLSRCDELGLYLIAKKY